MQAIPLILALLFAAPADAGEYQNKLAIALALADSESQAQATIVVKPEKINDVKPKTGVKEPEFRPDHDRPTAKPPAKPLYKEVRVTKWREETRCTKDRWGRKSCHKVRVPYTVIERVPVTIRTGGYPTTNKKTYRLDNGKGPKADWKHLTEGVHAGKYDPAWLRTLSQEEINALHSDDHMGTVKKNFIVRPH